MVSFLRFLSSFMKSRAATNIGTPENSGSTAPSESMKAGAQVPDEFVVKLRFAGQLLLCPSPEAVNEAGLLLEQLQAQLEFMKASSGGAVAESTLKAAQCELARIRKLVEGAMRVQWSRLRSLAALTQCYEPTGGISSWRPNWPKLDLKL